MEADQVRQSDVSMLRQSMGIIIEVAFFIPFI